MTATPKPQPERTPVCPCHDWPMLERVGQLGWVCLWCGAALAGDGTWGRWRDETPSDLVKWGKNGPARGEPPGPRPTPNKEAWA